MVIPTEHGGWGLTLEPGVLGLLVAPSWAGACLAAAALVAFLARNPARIALLDRRRGRWLPRTRLAVRVVAVETAGLAVLVGAAVVLADGAWWWPAVVAAPLLGLQLWFDARSQSRRLVPELAGASAIAAVSAMIVLAGGGAAALAGGTWLVLAGRSLTSLPYARHRIQCLHDRPSPTTPLLAGDAAALVAALAAAVLDRGLVVGAAAVVVLIGAQRIAARRPVSSATVVGIRQTALGFGLVVATAVGVRLA